MKLEIEKRGIKLMLTVDVTEEQVNDFVSFLFFVQVLIIRLGFSIVESEGEFLLIDFEVPKDWRVYCLLVLLSCRR
jgi:hypothetical protein